VFDGVSKGEQYKGAYSSSRELGVGRRKFKRSLPFHPNMLSSSSGPESILARWYQIVYQYKGLRLTILQDIFPAISGIAERVQKVTGFHYLAGLWLEHLYSDLL
jgi:hypothetical protein